MFKYCKISVLLWVFLCNACIRSQLNQPSDPYIEHTENATTNTTGEQIAAPTSTNNRGAFVGSVGQRPYAKYRPEQRRFVHY